jgi:hypothetical protein
MTRHQTNSAEMVVPAALSLTGTAFVVLTYLLFHRLRDLRYIEIVFYIALSDMLSATGIVLGPVETGSAACNYQAFASNYFCLTSVMWSTVVAYQLYLIVVQDGTLVNMKFLHGFIWIFSLVVTLLPLSTDTYGSTDDVSWCFLQSTPTSPSYGILMWTLLSFYIWLWISIFLILFFFFSIKYKLSQLESIPGLVSTAIYKLQLYPMILMICWAVPTYNDIRAAIIGHYDDVTIGRISAVMPALQGALLSIVFLKQNKLVVDEWKDVLSGRETVYNKVLGHGRVESQNSRIRGTPSTRSSNMTLSDGSQLASSRGSAATIEHTHSSEMITYLAERDSQTINEIHHHSHMNKSSFLKPQRIDDEDFDVVA